MSRRNLSFWQILVILFVSLFFSTSLLWSQPLSGVKYIGGSGADYASISAAIAALNSNGVALGGVTFRIRGGTYNEAPDSLMSWINTNEFSPVRFVPDDTLGVVINKTCTATARFAFSFNNADYITFDGTHPLAPQRRLIQINALDTAYAYSALRFINGSSYNLFRNLELSINLRASNTNGRVISISPSSSYQPLSGCKVDSFINCKLTGGNYSLYIAGESVLMNDSLYFEKNEFVQFYSYGTYINYTHRSKWVSNQYYRLTPSNSANVYGINVAAGIGTGCQWWGNWIYNLTPASGGSLYGIYINAGTNQMIANNMISLNPTQGGTVYGLLVSGGPANIFHNTIRIAGTQTINANSAAVYISGATSDTVVNNIFVNERTSSNQANYHLAAWYSNAYPFAYANNNLYSNATTQTNDNAYQIRYITTNYNTLQDLLTTQPQYLWDSSSVSALPTFVGSSDLHINPTQPTPVEGMGRAVPSVPFDFDYEPRNPTTPDIGADEGNFIAGNDFTAPTIRHTPLSITESDSPRVAVAFITDNQGIASGANAPRIYFKASTETVWQFNLVDSVRSDSIFYFRINGFPIGTTVQYYFAAQDLVGNVSTLPLGGGGQNPPGTTAPTTTFSYLVQYMVSGVKTIGSNNCDYPTLTAAFDAVRTVGIGSGGATFILKDTLYAEAPLTITGAFHRERPLLIRPDSGIRVTIQITGTTNEPWAIRFQRAFSVTLDGSWNGDPLGKHLTLRGSNLSNAVRMLDSACWNTVRMCSLIVNPSSSTSNRVVQIGAGSVAGAHTIGNRVEKCVIVGGYTGVYARGTSSQNVDSTVIVQNQIYDFYSYGINVGYGTGLKISNNTLYHLTPSNASTVQAIYMETQTNNSHINANLIGPMQNTASGAQTGIRTYGSGNLITNNMIMLGLYNSGNTYGINSADYAGSSVIGFNSVWIVGNSGNSNSTGYFNNTGGGMDTLIGNIFQNTRSGGTSSNYHTGFAVNSPPSLWFCNYNIYGVPHDTLDDNWYVGVFAGYRVNTMEELMQTEWFPRDSASYRELVPFLDTLNLHLSGIVPTYAENGAMARADVPFDFDGQPRGAIRCDIGADEGAFLSDLREVSEPIIKNFELSPIYPNPFNATAWLKVHLPASGWVQVQLYNVQGQKVGTILQSHLRAGVYSIGIDGKSLASGMYWIKVQWNHQWKVEKVCVVK